MQDLNDLCLSCLHFKVIVLFSCFTIILVDSFSNFCLDDLLFSRLFIIKCLQIADYVGTTKAVSVFKLLHNLIHFSHTLIITKDIVLYVYGWALFISKRPNMNTQILMCQVIRVLYSFVWHIPLTIYISIFLILHKLLNMNCDIFYSS